MNKNESVAKCCCGTGKMKTVDVINNDECVHCGYYVVWESDKPDKREDIVECPVHLTYFKIY